MIIKEPITDGDGSRSFISVGLSDEEEGRERILRIMEISRRKKTNITRSTKMKKTKINKLRLLTEINIRIKLVVAVAWKKQKNGNMKN